MAITSNLLAYYKLDESSGNAADASGAGFTLTNTNTVAFATGLINNGANFGDSSTTGINKQLKNETNYGVDNRTAWSISFWANLTAAPTNSNNQELSLIKFWRTGYCDIKYGANLGGKRMKISFSESTTTYTVDLGTGTWHHIVLTFPSTSLSNGKMYIDNSLVSSAVLRGAGDTGAYLFSVGSTDSIPGLIDEVGLWSSELTSDDVSQLYNSGDGLAYPFSSGASTSDFFNFI